VQPVARRVCVAVGYMMTQSTIGGDGQTPTPREFVESSVRSGRDTLYKTEQRPADFEFDDSVVSVFPDMIGRSVPGYWSIVDGLGRLAAQVGHIQGPVYDLGSSLGAVTWSVYREAPKQKRIIAVDRSVAMNQRLRLNLESVGWPPNIEVVDGDICEFPMESASVVILNLALQFVPLEHRLALLSRTRDALRPGGLLLLTEKITGASAEEEARLRAWHHQFKRQQGYSEQEIRGKANAIREVMPTETEKKHRSRLAQVGFSSVTRWYQAYNFVSWVVCR